MGEGRSGEQLAERDADAGGGLEQGGEAGGFDRAEAEADQVVFGAGAIAAGDLADGVEHAVECRADAGQDVGVVEQEIQPPLFKCLAGGAAADLAAGGAGQGAGADEEQAVERDFEVIGQTLADLDGERGERGERGGGDLAGLDREDDAVTGGGFLRKGGRTGELGEGGC